MTPEQILQKLGQAAHIIYRRRGRSIPATTAHTITTMPLAGLALMMRDARGLPPAQEKALGESIAELPSDMANTPVSIAHHDAFWLAYRQGPAACNQGQLHA